MKGKLNRTISLITHTSQVMLRIFINRMKKLEQEISITQAGFREGRETRDNIVKLRNIKKYKEHRLMLYMHFVDYSKVFGCISHNKM